ncbi:type 2 lantibiotic biosynthesis protein LanM [Inhella inkyongensis]|uniref:Type 2 lantibiotic biosynthesis protein LanM n=1 Tax=Inhella inkyongensis TaxID=392593 RepID=A0A840SA26_9BURK|nr:type 2 lanthipeptide synthetase LanM family protein [Inhella inkyongensis]MBB5205240.1 type 2 lantibiotic biosynthesis protein LanM [Inhella inkyongensis]
MASLRDASDFDAALGCLIAPHMAQLAAQLDDLPGLEASEAVVLTQSLNDSLLELLNAKLSRLLVLELHAAKQAGRLKATDSSARWTEFVQTAARPEFWAQQEINYPTLAARVRHMLTARCQAALQFARHLAQQRPHLDALAGHPLGLLRALSFGAGDSHQGGKTVVLLSFEQGRLVYKPRSVRIDRRLSDLVQTLSARLPGGSSMRVPRVLDGEDHGWTEFIAHRHAQGDAELAIFYRGIGHWLALMRLLSGSDLHAENLIAHGPHPVVVDCETLFTPRVSNPPSGLGDAADQAARLVSGTVLNIGLLPGRGQGLGWRGIDNSALGSLPGQQPMSLQPTILKAGTDEAHIGQVLMPAPAAQNHPSPEPALAQFWGEVLSGFDALTSELQVLDQAGELAPLLVAFEDCTVRVVTRATEVYAELGRMLWHPVSLHQEAPARERACDLMMRMGAQNALAPGRLEVVEAEVEDLLVGDVPMFVTTVAEGELQGPGGTRWLPPQSLAQSALTHWRDADLRLERHVIRAALVSAYINDGWMPAEQSLRVPVVDRERLDERRRIQAARILRELQATAIEGCDRSVAWIAPILGPAGWSVQPLEQDLYGGHSGIALLVASYVKEMQAGRADVIEGLPSLFERLLNTLELAEDKRWLERGRQKKMRPPPPGGYVGVASQIWTWLALEQLGCVDGRAVERACALAELLPEAAQADDMNDLLTGKAGAIVPLLQLARRTGQSGYLAQAVALGDALIAKASWRGEQLYWAHEQWPDGIGGFVHGASGMAWALEHLAKATAEPRFARAAAGAQAFDDALWDEEECNWLDLRGLEGARTAAAWCHGSVGIGLAALALDPELKDPLRRLRVQRAVDASARLGLGWNHSLCHGDASVYALLLRAQRAGVHSQEGDAPALLAQFLASLEAHGPVCGIARNVFVPGLMPGLGGVAYQLLAFHPDSRVPDVLTLGVI